MTTTAAPDQSGAALPPAPPAVALVGGLELVTRFRLRLTADDDSRLARLGAGYQLGAAAWTGARAAFVGFYTPPVTGAPDDLALRLRDASAWAEERLALQGAERCDVLLVALSPVDGDVAAPQRGGRVRIGAAAITQGRVETKVSIPGGLPDAGDLRRWMRTAANGSVPTLAAVDLAERQSVAGGYVAPQRAAVARAPVVSISLVSLWLAVYLVEVAVVGMQRGGGTVTELTMGGLPNSGAHTGDWWRYVTATVLHSHSSLLHLLGNGLFMIIVGGYVERIYGRLALLGTWLLTAVVANLLWVGVSSASGADPTYGIGASGGDFGLLGLIVMLGRVQGRGMVPGALASQMRQYAVTLAILNAVLGFSIAHVNNLVHVFGFLAGIGLGVVVPPIEALGGRRTMPVERWVVIGAAMVAVVALGVGAQHLLSVLDQPMTAPGVGSGGSLI